MSLSSLLKLLMFFFKGDGALIRRGGAFLKGGSVAVRSLFQAFR